MTVVGLSPSNSVSQLHCSFGSPLAFLQNRSFLSCADQHRIDYDSIVRIFFYKNTLTYQHIPVDINVREEYSFQQ